MKRSNRTEQPIPIQSKSRTPPRLRTQPCPRRAYAGQRLGELYYVGSRICRRRSRRRMGIGGNDLRLLIELKKRGHIPNGCSIVEIGAQQLTDYFLACRSELDTAGQIFGVAQRCPLPQPLAPAASGGQLQLLDPTAPWGPAFLDLAGSPLRGDRHRWQSRQHPPRSELR